MGEHEHHSKVHDHMQRCNTGVYYLKSSPPPLAFEKMMSRSVGLRSLPTILQSLKSLANLAPSSRFSGWRVPY